MSRSTCDTRRPWSAIADERWTTKKTLSRRPTTSLERSTICSCRSLLSSNRRTAHHHDTRSGPSRKVGGRFFSPRRGFSLPQTDTCDYNAAHERTTGCGLPAGHLQTVVRGARPPMHLKKVEIHGFKSFADSIKLDFEPGITAVVGPNGCGKSNI